MKSPTTIGTALTDTRGHSKTNGSGFNALLVGTINNSSSIQQYGTYGIDVSPNEQSVIASHILTASHLEQGGSMAPSLKGLNDYIYRNAIIIFFDLGCGVCTTQIEQLHYNYKELTKKGYRIISVSADQEEAVYQQYAKNFLWPDKL
ncbi:peroxiredoxin family protein [Dysgonomonas sp. OttesenSCG-928-M03]|nr:peroxiredoxin family protein [Dysgonomonas sp. OttesenSCG-928-M03]